MVSFPGLVDVYVGGHLVEAGEPLRRVRRVYAELSEVYRTTHPFAHARLADRQKLFTDLAGAGEPGGTFAEVVAGEPYRARIVPFLARLDYDPATRLACRWRPTHRVSIDPAINFGRPSVAGVPTYLIAEAFAANGRDVEWVAAWYGLNPSEVEAAVRFEGGLTA